MKKITIILGLVLLLILSNVTVSYCEYNPDDTTIKDLYFKSYTIEKFDGKLIEILTLIDSKGETFEIPYFHINTEDMDKFVKMGYRITFDNEGNLIGVVGNYRIGDYDYIEEF